MKGNKWNKTYPYTIPGLFDVNILFSIPSLSLAPILQIPKLKILEHRSSNREPRIQLQLQN